MPALFLGSSSTGRCALREVTSPFSSSTSPADTCSFWMLEWQPVTWKLVKHDGLACLQQDSAHMHGATPVAALPTCLFGMRGCLLFAFPTPCVVQVRILAGWLGIAFCACCSARWTANAAFGIIRSAVAGFRRRLILADLNAAGCESALCLGAARCCWTTGLKRRCWAQGLC